MAQIVTVLSTFWLARLYQPSAFGQFALLLSVVSAFSPAMGGHFDYAAVVESRPRRRRALFQLALICLILGSTALVVLITLFTDARLVPQSSRPTLAMAWAWPPLVWFGLIFASSLQLLRQRLSVRHLFGAAGMLSLLQALLIGLCSAFWALWWPDAAGLAVGYVAGIAVTLVMGVIVFDRSQKRLMSLSVETLQAGWLVWIRNRNLLAKRFFHYRRWPLFSASTTALDGITQSLPIWFLLMVYTTGDVGQYSLAIRLFSVPFVLLAGAVFQVSLVKASQCLAGSARAFKSYALKLLAFSTALVVVPVLLVTAQAVPLMTSLYGPQWQLSGQALAVLAPSIGLAFIGSSCSSILMARGHLRLLATWKLFSLAALGSWLWVTFSMRPMFLAAVAQIAAVNSVLYILLIVAIVYASISPFGVDSSERFVQ